MIDNNEVFNVERRQPRTPRETQLPRSCHAASEERLTYTGYSVCLCADQRTSSFSLRLRAEKSSLVEDPKMERF